MCIALEKHRNDEVSITLVLEAGRVARHGGMSPPPRQDFLERMHRGHQVMRKYRVILVLRNIISADNAMVNGPAAASPNRLIYISQ